MKKLIIIFVICYCYVSCRKIYNPPALRTDYNYLVVNGGLISDPDSPSVITLSRTVRLTDTTSTSIIEPGATITAESDAGDKIQFTETFGGNYVATPQIFDFSKKYRINITTTNGSNYQSDFVPLRRTPPIDSLSWNQAGDVNIYAYTHDTANDTKFYRWDYVETYQYQSRLNAELGQDNGKLFYVDNTPNQTYNCWKSVNSTNIVIGSSQTLGSDVINKQQVAIVKQNSQDITIRYSILVKQYAITKDCYNYLDVLKTNTENLGSIFDAQPTQLTGNYHSINNPSEIVIGYFSASSVQEKRLFISKYEVNNWFYLDTTISCDTLYIPHTPAPDPGFFVWDYPDPRYDPFYFCGTGCLAITKRECVDCRLQGGTNQKPSFW